MILALDLFISLNSDDILGGLIVEHHDMIMITLTSKLLVTYSKGIIIRP
jgi:hypothetical protein